jgi:hypothetical protein
MQPEPGPELGLHVLTPCWMPNLPSTWRWKAGNAVRKASSCGVWDEYLRWMLSGAIPVNMSISIG